MRIQDVLRLGVGLVLLATQPMGSAQRAGSACVTNEDCGGNRCCQADKTCSRRGMGTVGASKRAADACECASQVYDPDTKRCGCEKDGDCPKQKCCTVSGTCSSRAKGSILPGRIAADPCECVSNAFHFPTEKCLCSDDQPYCPDNKCCKANMQCSARNVSSVATGYRAGDACECASGQFDTTTSKCLCNDDSDCANNKCCTADGTCSSRSRGSVANGKIARHECECASATYDTDTKRCGCTHLFHCTAKPQESICNVTANTCVSAIGDPHMTGFAGQKFDFTGIDDSWYALISEPPLLQLNMRVTVPVPSQPDTTYITGFSLLTTDDDGLHHSIVVKAKEPHHLETACPVGVSPCLADGSLVVALDGEEVLARPGTVSLAPGIDITAVNIPGECRSFGFKAYWAKKKQENAAYWAREEQENVQGNRKLSAMLSMGEWMLADSSTTNMADCAEYVARSAAVAGGLFAHQSEHSSFRIISPAADIRLSHGKRYEFPTRDPTDTIDLPDSATWQMNIVIDHIDISNDAKGVLGETIVPTRDADGNMIMQGLRCIRGVQQDYAVEGPLGTAFTMDNSGTALKDATAGVFS